MDIILTMLGDSADTNLTERFGGFFRFGHGDSESGDLMDETKKNYGSGDRCSARRVINYKCRTEEVESGKFIQKCEKTEQLLRDCVGRPTELVESKTEYTENDISRDSALISNPLDGRRELAELEPYIPPVLRGDFDNFQQSLFGGLDSFIHAAEEMANDFFQNFRSEQGGETENPFRRFKGEENQMGDKPYKEEAIYADLAKDAKDFQEV